MNKEADGNMFYIHSFDIYIFDTWALSVLVHVTVEIATLVKGEDGKTKIEILNNNVVDEMIKKHEAEEAKESEKKKEKSWRSDTCYRHMSL